MDTFARIARDARGHADEIAKRARAQGRGLTANEQGTVDAEICAAHHADLSGAQAAIDRGQDGPRSQESPTSGTTSRRARSATRRCPRTSPTAATSSPNRSYATLIEKFRKVDPIFGRATVFEMTGNTTLMLPYKAAHGVVTTATETGARAEQTEPTFTAPTLVCYDYYSDQRASQQFIDSVADAEAMLLRGWLRTSRSRPAPTPSRAPARPRSRASSTARRSTPRSSQARPDGPEHQPDQALLRPAPSSSAPTRRG